MSMFQFPACIHAEKAPDMPEALSQARWTESMWRMRCLDHSAPYHLFISSIPYGELPCGDAALRIVEQDEKTIAAHQKCGLLERLSVADAYKVAALFSCLHGLGRTYPVDVLRRDAQAASHQPLMRFSFSDVDYVSLDVGGDYEQRL